MAGNQNSTSDMDQFSTFLQEAVQRIRTEEDPFVLNQYKKLFKKNVPFSLRTYVAAYLAKTAAEADKQPSSFKKRDRNKNKPQAKTEDIRKKEPKRQQEDDTAQKRPSPRRIEIDESLASTIFISVGRNRRVFPRDLVGLISQSAGIDRDRIGEIRVLDNYSFIQLFSEDAEKAIEKLNGFEYRGRNLSVSYSRKKDEDTGEKPAKKSRADDEDQADREYRSTDAAAGSESDFNTDTYASAYEETDTMNDDFDDAGSGENDDNSEFSEDIKHDSSVSDSENDDGEDFDSKQSLGGEWK